MTYVFTYVTESSFTDLSTEMLNKINGLTVAGQKSVKTGATDISGYNAKGGIFFCNEEAPNHDNLSGPWLKKVFKASHVNDACNACLEFLNGTTISNTQKYYSRVTMGNNDSSSYCTLFYRSQH